MQIHVNNLSHIYNPGDPFEAHAVRGVSFDVTEAQIIGLVGHTGCGKSTLIQHLNALLLPTDGTVEIDGIDTLRDKNRLRELRRRVGMVFQYPEYQLFEETIARDIAFGLKNAGLSSAEQEERIRKAMEDVSLDYDTYAQKSPFDLSGGQKRRAAIAGVLVMEPELLILDEPAAGLDPQGREEINGIIRRYHKEYNATVIIVSHNMNEVAALCHRVLVMNDGRLIMDGAPREIFSRKAEMDAIGLGVPYATQMAARLVGRGIPVRTDVLTVRELADELLRIKGGQSHA